MDRTTQTPADGFVGRTVGSASPSGNRYHLLERIGEGAMGAVYKAVDAGGGLCAVKMMHAAAVQDASLRTRFEREAQALFSLRHPNILEVRDYGVEAGLPYIVMEYLVGRTLESLIVNDDDLDPALGATLGEQVLTGLAFAHSKGVLHRDIKSENVFVSGTSPADYRCILLDFGLVKLDDSKFGPAQKLTMVGSVMGSPAYMSPEQGTGDTVDARTDVYSVGVVLYELIAGAWPFEAESQVDMFRMHLMEKPPSLMSKRAGLQARPELEAVVQTALEKKKEARFPDASAMLDALRRVPKPVAFMGAPVAHHVSSQPLPVPTAPLQSPPLQSPPLPPTLTPSTSAGTSSLVWIGLAVLALLLLLGAAGVVLAFLLLR